MRKPSSTFTENEREITRNCPITSTMLVIGGRWKVILLWHLRRGPLRYGALRRAVPRVTERMLAKQLRELADAGWVERTDYHEVPPRTDYRLTELGSSFVPILEGIYAWASARGIGAERSAPAPAEGA